MCYSPSFQHIQILAMHIYRMISRVLNFDTRLQCRYPHFFLMQIHVSAKNKSFPCDKKLYVCSGCYKGGNQFVSVALSHRDKWIIGMRKHKIIIRCRSVLATMLLQFFICAFDNFWMKRSNWRNVKKRSKKKLKKRCVDDD